MSDTELPRPACKRYIDDGHNRSRVRTAALFLITLAVVAALAWGVVGKLAEFHSTVARLAVIDRRTKPYRPLSQYPEARILDRAAGVSGPALRTSPMGGATLHVAATICNPHRPSVDVRSSLSYIPYVDGRQAYGSEFTVYAGVDETRPAGCIRYDGSHPFVTPVPVTVSRTNELLTSRGSVTWRLLLADTPVRKDGTVGVRVTTYSEPFHLVTTG